MTREETPDKEPNERNEESFQVALSLFKQASQRVPAYKDFLTKAKIDADKIETREDFAQIPPTDKPNYISAYRLEDLSWDGDLKMSKIISSSSGSTGIPFYWPRGDLQAEVVNKMFQRIYEDIFETRKGKTLFINSFALGTWIAGFEYYNAAKFTADKGSVISIATPGSEKSIAIDTIIRLAASFDRLVLAGYPPFLKDILESGAHEGIVWSERDVRLISGGEAFSERWRDGVLNMVGHEKSLSNFINIYGMAEAGVMGHETPLSVYIRKVAETHSILKKMLLHEGEVAPLYQYDPKIRYLESGEENTIVLTSDAGLPLIRYNTRDQGGIFKYNEIEEHLTANSDPNLPPISSTMLQNWKDLSFVYLLGRRDLSISFYALNIYVENIKLALETAKETNLLSGFFTMRVGYTRDLNQQFEIVIELARDVKSTFILNRKIVSHVVNTLHRINSEYSKLHSAIGRRALPKIRFVQYGEIETIPGRKHKWIKRS